MIEDDRIENARAAGTDPLTLASPTAIAVPAPAAALPTNRGGLASLVRPGFLRSLTSRQAQPDLERGQIAAAAA